MLQTSKFTGIDTLLDAGDLASDKLQQADNVFIEGLPQAGTTIVSRPGWVGQFTTALGTPIYEPTPFLDGSGNTQVIFGCGTDLYQSSKTATTPTKIYSGTSGTTSVGVSQAGLRMVRLGEYMYGTNGSGNIFRTNLSTSYAQFVSGLLAPTAAPTAGLSNVALDAMTSTSGWASDYLTGTYTGNQISNSDFTTGLVINGSGGSPAEYPAYATSAGGFTFIGPDVDFWSNSVGGDSGLPSGYTGNYVLMDDPGEGFYTTTQLPNDTVANDTSRYNTQFLVSFNYYTNNNIGGIRSVITAYSDTGGTTEIAQKYVEYYPESAGQNPEQSFNQIIDFPGLPVPIKSIRVGFYGASKNVRGSGVYITNISCIYVSTTPPLSLAVSTGGGFSVSHSELNSGYWGAYGGLRLTHTFGSNQNWSSYDVIALPVKSNTGSLTVAQMVASGLNLQFAFIDGSDNYYYTNALSWSSDYSYAYVDITTIPLATRQSFAQFQILWLGDISGTEGIGSLFSIGPLAAAGNLTIPVLGNSYSPYYYGFTELNDADNGSYVPQLVNVVESDGSPASQQIQPTGDLAIGTCVIPASVNSSTDWISIYRGGGVFTDGLLRLIATVPTNYDVTSAPYQYTDLVIGSTTTHLSSVNRPFVPADAGTLIFLTGGAGFNTGQFHIVSVSGGVAVLNASAGTAGSTGGTANIGDCFNRDLSNPYYTWNHTTRTLTDNTPDSYLFNASWYQIGRQAPPQNAQAMAAWQNRLWLGVGSTVYGSWNVVTNAESGMYFTTVDISTDPQIAIKGFTLTLGAADNDPIQAIVPNGAYLFVFKQYSCWIITGFDPSNFSAQQVLTDSGVGLVAPRGVCVMSGGSPSYTKLGFAWNHVWFVGSDGIYTFDGSTATAGSIPLQKVLGLRDDTGASLISASAYANIAMTVYDRKVYVMAPTSGDSTNTVMYVFDTRTMGWTRYLLGATSAAALTAQTDTNLCYFGGYDGQLYTLTGALDYATPGSAGTGFPITVVTKGFGQEAEGLAYFTKTRPTRVFFDVICAASTTWTITITGDISAAASTHTYTTGTGETQFAIKVRPAAQGAKPSVTMAATVTGQTRIRGIGLDASKGTISK